MMIVAIRLVCFSLFWVCMCASKLSEMMWINPFFAIKPVRQDLSVLITAAEILNLGTSHLEVTLIHVAVQLYIPT